MNNCEEDENIARRMFEAELTPDDRRRELARILAAGVLRLRELRKSSAGPSAESGDAPLEVSDKTVLSGDHGRNGQMKRADKVLVAPSRLSPQPPLYRKGMLWLRLILAWRGRR